MIPLVDLKLQYKNIKPEIDHAILSVLVESEFIKGKYVRQFEEEFAGYCGAKYCSGCNSATDALYLILAALGIKAGDEVIIPSMTFFATAESVVRTGAVPVICDVTEDGLIDIEDMKKRITPLTKAIVPVHLWGYPADMIKINEIAAQKGIRVVEDAAQAHGAFTGEEFKDVAEPGAFTPKTRTGTLGVAAAFSFFPGKNLGAYGDGGAVVTNDISLYQEINSLKDHGRQDKYIHDKIGYNSRLDGVQAAILSIKLKYLDRWNSARREIARKYNKMFLELKEITLPVVSRGCVMHLYVIRTEKRDELLNYLNQNKIMAGVHYPVPLHLQPGLKYLGYKKGDFPVSEKLADTVLSLPLYPEMSEEHILEAGNKVIQFFRS